MSYQCVQRDFNIQTKDNLSKHLESKHTVVYSCEQCQYKADDANHLDIHIETIHVNDQSEQHAIKYWEENVEKLSMPVTNVIATRTRQTNLAAQLWSLF